MLCDKCGLEAFIKGSRTEIEGDTSPDTTTKVYVVHEFYCRNPQCSNFEKSIAENRILIAEK